MNKLAILTLKAANKAYSKLAKNDFFGFSSAQARFEGQAASDLIKQKLAGPEPAMICRFGNVELNAMLNYHAITRKASLTKKIADYVSGRAFPFWWDEGVLRYMESNAGFIGANPESVQKFAELMIEDTRQVDILGTWMKGEAFFDYLMPKAVKIRQIDLEPFNHQNPWSEVLENKKVLVIHPYEASIKKQYVNFAHLFEDKRVLPSFELKTIKAVQSIAHNRTPYKSWFEALDAMKEQINAQDFDIAILGCGAYGFPLAAHIKRLGKKSVHLGGVTQLLFGVKGKRWENSYMEKHFNEYWKGPLPEEIPENFNKIEGGCYW